MYYIILFLGVISSLALVAWLHSPQRQLLARATALAAQGGHGSRAVQDTGNFTARLLRGERNEDKPCLTPIDCVRERRCAGHCGCR